MSKQKKAATIFTTVGEWVASGSMKTGFYALELVEAETEKAIGFKAEKFSQSGNLKPSVCWMPKSKLQEVANDYYDNGPARMFLVPEWLYNIKIGEGFVL